MSFSVAGLLNEGFRFQLSVSKVSSIQVDNITNYEVSKALRREYRPTGGSSRNAKLYKIHKTKSV